MLFNKNVYAFLEEPLPQSASSSDRLCNLNVCLIRKYKRSPTVCELWVYWNMFVLCIYFLYFVNIVNIQIHSVFQEVVLPISSLPFGLTENWNTPYHLLNWKKTQVHCSVIHIYPMSFIISVFPRDMSHKYYWTHLV